MLARLVWTLICGTLFVLGAVFFLNGKCWGAPTPIGIERPSIGQVEGKPEPDCEWMSEVELLLNTDYALSTIAQVGLERIVAQMRAEGTEVTRIDRAWLGTALDTAIVFLIVDDCLIGAATAPAVEVEAIIQGRDPP